MYALLLTDLTSQSGRGVNIFLRLCRQRQVVRRFLITNRWYSMQYPVPLQRSFIVCDIIPCYHINLMFSSQFKFVAVMLCINLLDLLRYWNWLEINWSLFFEICLWNFMSLFHQWQWFPVAWFQAIITQLSIFIPSKKLRFTLIRFISMNLQH